MIYLLFINGRYIDTYSGTGPLLLGAHANTRYGTSGTTVEYVQIDETTLNRTPIQAMGVTVCPECGAISKRNGQTEHSWRCPERD